jgi:Divergent InlB B-repeat domain
VDTKRRKTTIETMKAILLSCLVLTALHAQAGVVCEQPHDGSGTLHHSSRYQANGTDYDQYVWDSFSVTDAQAVTEIRWRGGYIPDWSYWAGQITNFRVCIYASLPGLSQPILGPGYPHTPATLMAYDTGDKAGETSAGVFGGVEMFDYHFTLPTPFQAAANTVYWVQIEADFINGIPSWGFANGSPNGSHFRRIPNQADYYFQIAPGNAAFSVITSDGPVYNIAASASPLEGGTITNTGLYPENSAAPLIATPNPGYAFANWIENGTVVSTNPNYTFTVTNDRTLVANFSAGSLITVASSPIDGGTSEGRGSFVNGSSVTVQAQAAANYAFVNWTENDVPVSTNASYTFTNLGIVFNQPPAASGTLMLSSYLAPDGNVDNMEYRFEKFTLATTTSISHLGWRGGYAGDNFAANPVVEFIIKIYGSTANGFYPDLANPVLKKYTITGNANETASDMFGGVQMFDYSFTLPTSFVATAGVGYWIQIEASQYGYPLTWGHATGAGGNNAHYRRMGNSYYSGTGDLALALSANVPTTFSIDAIASAGGVVGGLGNYALDAVVNLTATANAGSVFVNWTEGGVIVSSSPLHSFSATTSRALVANFVPSCTLALASSSTAMGTVSGAGTFPTGDTVTATATAKPGYVFLNWTESGTIVSTMPIYAFPILTARTLRANFAVGYSMTASSSFAPGGSVTGSGGYATGGIVTLSASVSDGYRFTGWTENGVPVSASTVFSFTSSANRMLVAHFVPILGVLSGVTNEIQLSWPASAAGWTLEESPDLSAGSWSLSSRAVTTVNGTNHIAIPTTAGRRFFHLSEP